uniref:Protein argonaute N-terminal domain-containing protein n=1 Tax=Petromyzon marinus TaxID=7757 RepID=S4RV71_PETMA
ACACVFDPCVRHVDVPAVCSPVEEFQPPLRPSLGSLGRTIRLQANFFQVDIPKGFLQHYEVEVKPDKCPRRVNREVVLHMVQHYKQIFGERKPVYDGRQNLYTATPLPIGWDRHIGIGMTECPTGPERLGPAALEFRANAKDLVLRNTISSSVMELPYSILKGNAVILKTHRWMRAPPFSTKPCTLTNHCANHIARYFWLFAPQVVNISCFPRMLAMAVSATAFYKAQPVVEFLCEILGVHSLDDQRKPLTDSQRVAFT